MSYLLDRQIGYARRKPAAAFHRLGVNFRERLAIGLGSLRDILPARPVWTSGYVMGLMRQPVPVPDDWRAVLEVGLGGRR